MLREKVTSQQNEYEIVQLEELVSEDHLLRKIEKAGDFKNIHTSLIILVFGFRLFIVHRQDIRYQKMLLMPFHSHLAPSTALTPT